MNTDHVLRQNGDKALGNRSRSLGAVLKERGGERGVPAAPEIEYELGNGDLGSDSGDEDASEGAASSRRIVMMYDEYGNASPMPMAKFYYDNVQQDHCGTENTTSNTQTEEETACSNISAPFKAKLDKPHDSESSTENAREIQASSSRVHDGGHIKLIDDAEGDEYEDDCEKEDPFANQFMRIQVPAAQLKDVSRVKKDVDHDKEHRRRTMIGGLQRAMSSVRIADNSRTRAAPSSATMVRQQTRARMSAVKMGRLVSRSKEKKQNSEMTHDSSEEQTSPDPEGWGRSQRPRESSASKPGVRQGLAAMGRIMSLKKSKSRDPASSSIPEQHDGGQREDSNFVEGSGRPQSMTSPSAEGLAGLTQVGRVAPIGQEKSVPSASGNASTPQNKAGFVSGTSEADSMHSEISVDRERTENRSERQGSRMGLTRIGRIMSFTRTKKQQVHKQLYTGPEKKGQNEASNTAHLSPLSSSTVSSKAVDASSPALDTTSHDVDRDRSRHKTPTSSRKEGGRMNLRSAGRLLSFSRKPQAATENDTRGHPAEETRIRHDIGNRAQSVPPKNMDKSGEDEGTEGKGEKLDGRASKFFYSTLNSERIRATRIIGSEAHIRVPVIAMAEYSGPVSRNKWYIDGFTLPHNAVRRECIDLYEVLMGLAKCGGDRDVTRDDIDNFEDWWKTASGFFRCYFEMERRILFPWVDGVKCGEWEVEMALRKMKAMKDKLQEQLNKIDQVWNEKMFKDPGEMYGLVYRTVDEFVPRLVNYLADQEVLLPALVKGFYKLEDRLRIDKEMVKLFMGGDVRRGDKEEAHHNLILLIRWIASPRQLRAWIGKNLNSHARAMYASWYALYQEEHYRFVKTIRSRGREAAAT